MVSYIKDNYINDVSVIDDPQSYLPSEYIYKTEEGFPEEEIPVLTGDDNIFSDLSITSESCNACRKAADFIAEFTRVFAKEKEQNRAYSKFIQNKNELPDVELDWVFQYFRVTFLFSVTEDDYYCITRYDEKTGKYDSTTGPLKKDNYKAVAEEVMQKVQ